MKDDLEDRIKDHFLMFDQEGKGYITIQNLGIALRSLGYHVEEKDLKEIMNEFDRNKNCQIDFDEFYHLVTVKMKNPLSEDELREAFLLFDKDNNGKITCSELKKALTS